MAGVGGKSWGGKCRQLYLNNNKIIFKNKKIVLYEVELRNIDVNGRHPFGFDGVLDFSMIIIVVVLIGHLLHTRYLKCLCGAYM